MSLSSACEVLPWDTEFFGFGIAHVKGSDLPGITRESLAEWCRENRIRCLYLCAPAEDAALLEAAQAAGFNFVDIRMTLERPVVGEVEEQELGACQIRGPRPEDLDLLKQLAAVSHSDSRFNCDRRFPRLACGRLYETWIERSCAGWAQCVLVLEVQGQARGYITCHVHPDGKASIGLLAVAAEIRGRGAARRLIDAALRWMAEHRIPQVRVVTQGRNTAAQRLYQKCGFRTRQVEVWLHQWFEAS